MQYGYLREVGAPSRGLESGSFKYLLLQGLLSIVSFGKPTGACQFPLFALFINLCQCLVFTWGLR